MSTSPHPNPIPRVPSASVASSFPFPRDITTRRIFWVLFAVFAVLLAFAVFLVILLLDITVPQGFERPAASPVPTFLTSYYGPSQELLKRPSGVALSPSGEVYVSDTGNARVVILNQKGEFLREVKSFGEDEEAFTEATERIQTSKKGAKTPQAFVTPTSLAFAPDGRWYIVDTSLRCVLIFDSEDVLLRMLTFEEESPISVKVNQTGARGEQLFVSTKSGIALADLDGNFVSAYLNWGRGQGQLDNPSAALVFNPALADPGSEQEGNGANPVESSANIEPLTLICDVLNYRIQAFSSFETSPSVRWTFGSPLPGDSLKYEGSDRRFGLPADMALTPDGRLLVVDGLSSEIAVLDARTGLFSYTISDVGSEDGLLYYPSAICYEARKIYVADKFNNRITVFTDTPPAKVPVVAKAQGPSVNRWWFLLPCVVALSAALGRLIFLRPPRYVLDLSFLENLANDRELQGFVIRNFAYLSVAAGTEAAAQKTLLGFAWKTEAYDAAVVDELLENYPTLDEQEATALALASNTRRKTWLLSASRELEKAAADKKVSVLHFAEFHALATIFLEAERQEYEKKATGLAAEVKPEAEPEKERLNASVKKPANKKPAARKLANKKPDEKKPADKTPTAKKLAAKKSAAKKSATQTGTKKTAVKKAAAKKPADKKPAEKKPADKTPTAKKPAPKKGAAQTGTKKTTDPKKKQKKKE